MNRTVEISFFDPRAIEGEKLDVNIVVKVELIEPSLEYRVTFKDGSTKILPSTIPLDSVQIVSASMVGDNLVIHLDDGRQFDIGRIATIPTFDDITPVGTGVLMPGSKTQFKELLATGGGLSVTKTAESVKIKMLSGGGSGFASTDPGEIDFTDIYIGERFTTDVYDIGSGRTWYVDDLTGLAENTWHDYVFTRTQLDTLGKYANGAFSLTAGQYYIDFHINLLAPASFNLRLQDVTNDVTLMQGTVVNNEGTYVMFSSFTSDIVGDFILPADANVKVQFKWTGGDAKRVISPTRVNAVTGGCIGGQIFLSKIAPFESAVNDVPPKPLPTTAAITALREMLLADPQYTLEVLPPVGGDGLETHATVAQYQSKSTTISGLTYLFPAAASKIAAYNPETNEAHHLNHTTPLVGPVSFAGGVSDSSGHIYLCPWDHTEFLRITTRPVDGWDRPAVEGGYDLLGPGLLPSLPQLTINGPSPAAGWGDISTTLIRNRGNSDTLRYKSDYIGEAEFTFELEGPEVIKGISLTNLLSDQVTGFEVHGQALGETEYSKIADVDVDGTTNPELNMKLTALAPESTALYKAIKLVITKGANYQLPTEFSVEQTNLIAPMTADVSAGQVASASSYFAERYSPWTSFAAAGPSGGWLSSGDLDVTPAAPAWIEIDLGKKTRFNSVAFANFSSAQADYAASPKSFTIEGWDDIGSKWDVLHTVVGKTTNTPGLVNKYERLGAFSYRRVRIVITAVNLAPSPRKYVAIGKIEIYDLKDNIIVPMTANVSSGQTATASGSYDGTTPPWSPFTDTVSWFGWASPNVAVTPAAPVWLEIDLGTPKTFDAFALSNRGYNTQAGFVGSPKDFQLQGWDATSSTWKVILSVANRTDNVAASTTYYPRLGSQTYQRVRIYITGRNGTTSGNYVCVGKFELFNTGAGGGKFGIEKLELITPEPKDLTLPYGYVEKIGAAPSTTNKWSDAIYCPVANKVLFVPSKAGTFVVYDVATGEFASTNFGLTIPAANAAWKAVYNPINHLIYVAPALLNFVPIIDLVNMRSKVLTVKRPTIPANNVQWCNAFIGVDGRVYFIPFYSTEWLVICPHSGAYWLENFGEVADVNKQSKVRFGTYGADGRFYISDWPTGNNYLGLDTLNLTKKRVNDPQLTKVVWANFSDKFGNVYLLNGVTENNLIRLNFGLTEPIHPDLLTGQFN